MWAVVLEGVNQTLKWQKIAKPELQEGEALVRIKAASFNRRDYWIQKGQYAGLKFPIVLGSDGAGIVEAVHSDTGKSWLNKEVIINPSLNWGSNQRYQSKEFSILGLPDNGTFAEYIKIPVSQLYEKPNHLNFHQAAALPLAGLTAYRSLFYRANLTAGENILIVGAGGGVSSIAIQLAKAAGANVFATSGNERKMELARGLGANYVTNYKNKNWSEDLLTRIEGFDVVLDSALGKEFAKHIGNCLPGGRIVLYGGTSSGELPQLDARQLFWKQLSILGSTMGSPKDFQSMLDFVIEHKIVPTIDSVFPFKEAETAIRLMDDSTQFGKIILSDTN